MRGFDTRRHGHLCSCRLLAQAVGCDPKTIRFEYCRAVLMKHWVVQCNHGCLLGAPKTAHEQQWHEMGPIDPIKAIIINNK